MAVKTVQYVNNQSQDTSRGPSQGIWGDCPIEDPIQGFGGGIGTFGFKTEDDFTIAGNLAQTNAIGNFGQWGSWIDTNGVLGTDPMEEGGVILLSDGGNASVGMNIGSNAAAYQIITGATAFPLKGKLWFECRVAVGSITTGKRDAFIGLMDNTAAPVQADNVFAKATSNALVTTNGCLGFHFRSTTNPTDVGLAFNVAGGTVQYPTNLQTLSLTVAGAALTAYAAVSNGNGTGFIKLGFVFDPTADNPAQIISSASSGQTAGNVAKPLLKVFVNGQIAPAFLTSTNVQAATFPANKMAPVIGYMSRSGTSAGGLYVDWIRVCQLGSF